MDEEAATRRMAAADQPPRAEAEITLCPLCLGAGEVAAPDGETYRCGWCQGIGED